MYQRRPVRTIRKPVRLSGRRHHARRPLATNAIPIGTASRSVTNCDSARSLVSTSAEAPVDTSSVRIAIAAARARVISRGAEFERVDRCYRRTYEQSSHVLCSAPQAAPQQTA
jgi:hypothetical protein